MRNRRRILKTEAMFVSLPGDEKNSAATLWQDKGFPKMEKRAAVEAPLTR